MQYVTCIKYSSGGISNYSLPSSTFTTISKNLARNEYYSTHSSLTVLPWLLFVALGVIESGRHRCMYMLYRLNLLCWATYCVWLVDKPWPPSTIIFLATIKSVMPVPCLPQISPNLRFLVLHQVDELARADVLMPSQLLNR